MTILKQVIKKGKGRNLSLFYLTQSSEMKLTATQPETKRNFLNYNHHSN